MTSQLVLSILSNVKVLLCQAKRKGEHFGLAPHCAASILEPSGLHPCQYFQQIAALMLYSCVRVKHC